MPAFKVLRFSVKANIVLEFAPNCILSLDSTHMDVDITLLSTVSTGRYISYRALRFRVKVNIVLGFAPNCIISLESTHMMLTSLSCQQVLRLVVQH